MGWIDKEIRFALRSVEIIAKLSICEVRSDALRGGEACGIKW